MLLMHNELSSNSQKNVINEKFFVFIIYIFACKVETIATIFIHNILQDRNLDIIYSNLKASFEVHVLT